MTHLGIAKWTDILEMQLYPLVADYIKNNSSDWVSFQQDSIVKILYPPEELSSLAHFITDI